MNVERRQYSIAEQRVQYQSDIALAQHKLEDLKLKIQTPLLRHTQEELDKAVRLARATTALTRYIEARSSSLTNITRQLSEGFYPLPDGSRKEVKNENVRGLLEALPTDPNKAIGSTTLAWKLFSRDLKDGVYSEALARSRISKTVADANHLLAGTQWRVCNSSPEFIVTAGRRIRFRAAYYLTSRDIPVATEQAATLSAPNTLIQQGEIEKLPKGRTSKAPKYHKEAMALRQEGLSRQAIAQRLGIKKDVVGYINRWLIKQGMIESKIKTDIATRMTEHLLKLQEKQPDKPITIKQVELAKQFGISRQRVNQLIKKIQQQHSELRIQSRQPAKELAKPAKRDKRKYDIAQLVKLRQADLSNQEIAHQLNLSVGIVRRILSELIAKGEIKPQRNRRSSAKTAEFDQQVKVLREAGLTNRAIAMRLNLLDKRGYYLVSDSVQRLLRRGEIVRRKSYDKTGSILEQVKQLRNAGLGNSEIAARLGVKVNKVAQAAVKLIQQGEITKQSRPLKPKRKPETTNQKDQL